MTEESASKTNCTENEQASLDEKPVLDSSEASNKVLGEAKNDDLNSFEGVCPKCGAENTASQKFCGNCGTPLGEAKVDDEGPAPKIGQMLGTAEDAVAEAIKEKVPEEHKSKISRKTGGIVLATLVAVVVVVLVAVLVPKGVNFKSEFSDISSKSYCTISSDGSSMTIDTNPHDIDDYSDSDAVNAIKSANTKLGFSDSLYSKMGKTRALDGTQTDSNDRVKVSWTFHPDNGLEVLYEKK